MKLAIAYAMLLAFFGPSAAATDERGPRANSAATASTPDSVAPVTAEHSSAEPKPIASLPAQPMPAEPAPDSTSPAAPAPSNALSSGTLSPTNALPAPPAALIKLKQPPRMHSFFDARNTFGLASLGASLTADALSTQKGLAYPGLHEMNPIARPFVQTRVGAAAYNAGSFGLMAGLMYWAHKKEHHRLERILPFAVGSWEGLLSFRNYRVIANRTK